MYTKLTKQQIKVRDAKILARLMPDSEPKKKKLTLKQIFYK